MVLLILISIKIASSIAAKAPQNNASVVLGTPLGFVVLI